MKKTKEQIEQEIEILQREINDLVKRKNKKVMRILALRKQIEKLK